LGLNREIGPKKPSEFTITQKSPMILSSAVLLSAMPLPSHARGCRPANPCEGFDQGGALHAKVAAHGRLGHAAIQCGDDGV